MAFPQNERLIEAFWYPVPTAYASLTAAQTGAAIDLQRSRKVAFIIGWGTLAVAETITMLIQGSVNGSSGWTTIAGTTQTALTAGGSNKCIVLETNAENVNAGNTANGTAYRYVRYSVAGAVGSPVQVASFAGAGPEEPQSTYNPAGTTTVIV